MKKDMRLGVCSCEEGIKWRSSVTEVVMRAPDGGLVSIDVCIASEIGKLWMNGVETVESCCGHGYDFPSVYVAAGSVEKMEQLGYEHYEDLDPKQSFILTGKPLPVKAANPYAEGWKTRGGDRTANNPDEAEILRYMREVDEEDLKGHAFYEEEDENGEEEYSPMKFPALYELKRRGRLVPTQGGFAPIPQGLKFNDDGTFDMDESENEPESDIP